jgi:hypothetical protein
MVTHRQTKWSKYTKTWSHIVKKVVTTRQTSGGDDQHPYVFLGKIDMYILVIQLKSGTTSLGV